MKKGADSTGEVMHTNHASRCMYSKSDVSIPLEPQVKSCNLSGK